MAFDKTLKQSSPIAPLAPVGGQVSWKWMGREIIGVVIEIYTKPVSKLIKDKTIKRNGSPKNPAYLVQSEAGNLALKLQSELKHPTKNPSWRIKPKMFGD